MLIEREKFATQVDKEVLAAIRQIARDDGRQLQVVVEEALKAHIVARATNVARPHVMQAYRASIARFGSLYEKLAK